MTSSFICGCRFGIHVRWDGWDPIAFATFCNGYSWTNGKYAPDRGSLPHHHRMAVLRYAGVDPQDFLMVLSVLMAMHYGVFYNPKKDSRVFCANPGMIFDMQYQLSNAGRRIGLNEAYKTFCPHDETLQPESKPHNPERDAFAEMVCFMLKDGKVELRKDKATGQLKKPLEFLRQSHSKDVHKHKVFNLLGRPKGTGTSAVPECRRPLPSRDECSKMVGELLDMLVKYTPQFRVLGNVVKEGHFPEMKDYNWSFPELLMYTIDVAHYGPKELPMVSDSDLFKMRWGRTRRARRGAARRVAAAGMPVPPPVPSGASSERSNGFKLSGHQFPSPFLRCKPLSWEISSR